MKIRSLILASVAALTASVAAVPAAVAAPGNAVIFGDSYPSNPTMEDYLAQKGAPIPSNNINKLGCAVDPRFAGAYAAAAGGREVQNYSCAGASYSTGGWKMNDAANKAAELGDLNAGTSEVVVMAGANDTYPYVINKPPLPVPQIQENLRNHMVDNVNHIRALAPNARIKIVGYPHLANADDRVCLLNVVPGAPTPDPLVRIGELEWAVQDAGMSAAQETGATFVDVKGISNNHEMCSNDRWVAGLVDFTSGPRNIALHMTNFGLGQVADHIGRS